MTDKLEVLVAKMHSGLSCKLVHSRPQRPREEGGEYLALVSKKPKRSLLTFRLSMIASTARSDSFTASALVDHQLSSAQEGGRGSGPTRRSWW